MTNSIETLIQERDAAKRRARNNLDAMLSYSSGSMNYGWYEGQLDDVLKEYTDLCAAIEDMGFLKGHAVTVDNLAEYAA